MTYEDVISFGNLYKGLLKAKRNTTWKDSVAGYSINGLKNTYKLRQSLLNGKYKISEYQKFTIYEPKVREILATRIKDRQFQRALCDNAVYESLTRSFIRDNVACQKERGVDDAIERMKTHLHRFYRQFGKQGYILKCDVHHFFPETDHEVAKTAVRKHIQDERVSDCVCTIIDSFGGTKGIGLGSQVSQLVELCVLNDLDHYIKEQLHIKYYVRYMDDFILMHESKDYLKECMQKIRCKLTGIKLELNEKTEIFSIRQGVIFLKWRFMLSDTGKVIMHLDNKNVSKERRKLAKLKEKIDNNELTIASARDNFQSWQDHARHGSTQNLVDKMRKYYFDLFKEEAPNGKNKTVTNGQSEASRSREQSFESRE